jgi:hypothetical protein
VLRAIAILVAASVAVVLAACGSDSSSTTDATSTGRAAPSPPTATGAPETTTGPEDRPPRVQAPRSGHGEGDGASQPGSEGGSNGAGGGPEYKPDDSLQTFGDEVHGRARAEVSRAVLALFRSLAKPDYPRICARIAEANREQILQYARLKRLPQQGCAAVLAMFMSPPNAVIRRSPRSKITHVRVNGDESIVFFRPPGGKVSYIPMVREGGRWKSVTLVPGTPVNPTFGQR